MPARIRSGWLTAQVIVPILVEAEYSTISVSLGNPSISVVTPVIPGSFDLRSIPDNVSVVINGDYQGSTPLTVSGLNPGSYNITFSRFNYEKFSTPATIEAGSITEVTATLQPKTGTLVINTTLEVHRWSLTGPVWAQPGHAYEPCRR